MSYSLDQIATAISPDNFEIKGKQNCSVCAVHSLSDAGADSLAWVKPGKIISNGAEVAAGVLVCNEETATSLTESGYANTCIVVNEPKRIFSKIVNALFVSRPAPGVHPTAYISPKAIIGEGCYIGPFCYIGACEIGDGSIVHGHCYFYEKVRIGKNALIHAGVVIGSDGFGYSKDENGVIEKFPHIGGVVIGDDVEIGANTCIDRGALGNTIIGNGVKIDNLVHVAHNVVLHENVFLIAHAMIGGSTEIGRGAWIAPSAALLQQLQIGANATVGVGAVVTKNVPANETWTGAPAKPLSEFLNQQKKIKNLP